MIPAMTVLAFNNNVSVCTVLQHLAHYLGTVMLCYTNLYLRYNILRLCNLLQLSGKYTRVSNHIQTTGLFKASNHLYNIAVMFPISFFTECGKAWLPNIFDTLLNPKNCHFYLS